MLDISKPFSQWNHADLVKGVEKMEFKDSNRLKKIQEAITLSDAIDGKCCAGFKVRIPVMSIARST